MPDITPTDVTSLIHDTRQLFKIYDPFESDLQRIEAGTYDFRAHVPPVLANVVSDKEDTRVVVLDRSLTNDRSKLRSAIDWPLRHQVFLGSAGRKAGSKSDMFEAFFAHNFRRMDPRGQKLGRVYDNMVDHRFGALWLSSAGVPDKATEDERSHWQRWDIRSLSPDTVGFLDYQGDPTWAVVEEALPAIEVIQQYGDKDSKDYRDGNWGALALNEFKHIRLADGRNIDRASEADFLRGRIIRCICDDGVTIKHYLKSETTTSRDTIKETYYQQEDHTFSNNYGRPSLFIFTGIYRPDAVDDVIKYEGLLGPLGQVTRDIVICQSIVATAQANPKRAEMEVPPHGLSIMDLANQAGIKSTAELPAADFSGVPRFYGRIEHWVDDVVEGFTRLQERLEKLRDDMRSPLQLLYPDAQTAENATLGAILFGAGGALRNYKGPNASIQTNIEQIDVAIARDIVRSSSGPAAKRSMEWTMFGDEF